MNIIGLIGRTNSGKSTLLNNLIGKKIAAVTDKVNTTQVPLSGIYYTSTNSWLILDAPGTCQIKTNLDRLIFHNIHKVIELSDLIWWMISSKDQWKKDNQVLANLLENIKKPVFLLINMIDLVDEKWLLQAILLWKEKFSFTEIIPISAKKKRNFSNLITATAKHLVNKSKNKMVRKSALNHLTDLVAEVVREQIINQTNDEIPHQTTLLLDSYQDLEKKLIFNFTLVVSTKSQKAIILGKQGSKIKNIRIESQKILTKITKKHPSLFLTVKVHKNWYQDIHFLKKLNIDWKHNYLSN